MNRSVQTKKRDFPPILQNNCIRIVFFQHFWNSYSLHFVNAWVTVVAQRPLGSQSSCSKEKMGGNLKSDRYYLWNCKLNFVTFDNEPWYKQMLPSMHEHEYSVPFWLQIPLFSHGSSKHTVSEKQNYMLTGVKTFQTMWNIDL